MAVQKNPKSNAIKKILIINFFGDSGFFAPKKLK